jgi:hypothetical protein
VSLSNLVGDFAGDILKCDCHSGVAKNTHKGGSDFAGDIVKRDCHLCVAKNTHKGGQVNDGANLFLQVTFPSLFLP